MIQFVVARYQENVDWTNGLPHAVIYNKGATPPNSKHPVVSLPNLGREGLTYLHHIIENYDQLDDYTCFLQGNPFDHTPRLEQHVSAFQRKLDAGQTVPGYEPLSKNIYHINLCYDKTDFSLHALLIDTYRKIFGCSKTDHNFSFAAGAQFIVSKETIRSRPKSFYESIIPLLSYSVHPAEGFALERFWGMIFTHSE